VRRCWRTRQLILRATVTWSSAAGWRYDLAPLGPSETEVTLTDWSAVPQFIRERGSQFPPFGPEQCHLVATPDATSKHGVWRTKNWSKIGEWVELAPQSIEAGDGYVVNWKPGNKPGRVDYLVNMGREIGYLSGSSIPSNTRPPATHCRVATMRRGYALVITGTW
jgi:hypothetical protein